MIFCHSYHDRLYKALIKNFRQKVKVMHLQIFPRIHVCIHTWNFDAHFVPCFKTTCIQSKSIPWNISGVLQRKSAQPWAVEGRYELETACPQFGAFIIELNHTHTKNEGEISKANHCSKIFLHGLWKKQYSSMRTSIFLIFNQPHFISKQSKNNISYKSSVLALTGYLSSIRLEHLLLLNWDVDPMIAHLSPYPPILSPRLLIISLSPCWDQIN